MQSPPGGMLLCCFPWQTITSCATICVHWRTVPTTEVSVLLFRLADVTLIVGDHQQSSGRNEANKDVNGKNPTFLFATFLADSVAFVQKDMPKATECAARMHLYANCAAKNYFYYFINVF